MVEMMMNKSEYRTMMWKLRRERQIRTRIVSLLMAVIAALVIALTYFAITANAQEISSEKLTKYYTWVTVESGDTLSEIAEDYYCESEYKSFNHYLNEICKINNLESADKLTSGRDLYVPYFSTELK